METTLNLDLAQVARDVNLPVEKVQTTVELLDDGNTVPFITRYRKDRTGGLDEEQIRLVHESVEKWRALADRKQRILKSLQAQGKLTDELTALIEAADSLRRLEDIYLPFKPKKQTLANLARSRGLEPLALEILNAAPEAADLQARAAQFVNEETGLKSVEEVLQGAGHLIAELYSENLELRDELRKILRNTGKLVSTRIEESAETGDENDESDEDGLSSATDVLPEGSEQPEEDHDQDEEHEEAEEHDELDEAEEQEELDEADAEEEEEEEEDGEEEEHDAFETAERLESAEAQKAESPDQPEAVEENGGPSNEVESTNLSDDSTATAAPSPAEAEQPAADEPTNAGHAASEPATADGVTAEAAATEPTSPTDVAGETSGETTAGDNSASEPAAKESSKRARRREKKLAAKLSIKQLASKTRKESKKRKREQKIESFKDYFNYQEPLSKIPPHRLLAINRGDRSKILRVKIEVEAETLLARAEHVAIPAGHPHAEYLRGRLRDALNRLIVPSLEREVRRELTEYAEQHAVQVFARNLRKLLLQPPVHNRRVLAIDPGFRSGCKLAALDEFGNVLGHTVIHVIGKDEVVRRGRQQMVEMILMYHIPVIAIGNGTACRETEKLVADIIANELKHREAHYIIVNEAGASVYSTSSVGREELPRFDPVLRSAVSIGRRLQDPLSELVKINPANIGVGLYQHDVKAKHLQDSLDAVVESCVNFVGVDVNTASPALLRYVSGLNQLTARRLYEYRQKHGPFRSRDQFKQVPGFGEATFVQSAGFLKILGGDNPLDATWIHPESYDTAEQVIDKLGGTVAELAARIPARKTAVSAARSAMAQFARGVLAESHHERDSHSGTAVADSLESAGRSAQEHHADPQPAVDSQPVDDDSQPAADSPAVAVEQPAADASPEASPIPDSPPAAAPADTTAEYQPHAEATPAAEPANPSSASAPALPERAARADAARMAAELGIGELMLRDMLNSLSRPGRDPREDLPQPLFRREIMKLEDLEPGMELSGSVLNVVDFGAFVDIGLPDSGLVHISRLADRFVRDPHEVVSVGDILNVWVVDVDKQRRRVSLTAVRPGTEKPTEQRRDRNKPSERRESQGQPSQSPPGDRKDSRRGDRRRDGRRPPAGRDQRSGGREQVQQRPAPKPKPVRPITPEMVDGKEPMRSFSDLMQFFEKKTGPEDEDKKKKKK